MGAFDFLKKKSIVDAPKDVSNPFGHQIAERQAAEAAREAASETPTLQDPPNGGSLTEQHRNRAAQVSNDTTDLEDKYPEGRLFSVQGADNKFYVLKSNGLTDNDVDDTARAFDADGTGIPLGVFDTAAAAQSYLNAYHEGAVAKKAQPPVEPTAAIKPAAAAGSEDIAKPADDGGKKAVKDMEPLEFLNYMKPEDEKKAQKKIRAAKIANYIMQGANVANAWINLIGTAHGGNNIEIPEMKGPDIASYVAKNEARREKYNSALLAWEKQKETERKNNAAIAYQNAKSEAVYAKQELDALKEKRMWLQYQDTSKLNSEQIKKLAADIREIDSNIAKKEAELAIKQQDAETRRINAETGRYNAQTSRMNAQTNQTKASQQADVNAYNANQRGQQTAIKTGKEFVPFEYGGTSTEKKDDREDWRDL